MTLASARRARRTSAKREVWNLQVYYDNIPQWPESKTFTGSKNQAMSQAKRMLREMDLPHRHPPKQVLTDPDLADTVFVWDGFARVRVRVMPAGVQERMV